MNVITDEGKLILARSYSEQFVFTRACFDSGDSLDIIGGSSSNNVYTLKLRVDNSNVTSTVVYNQVWVYAKISTDVNDVLYAIIDKSSYIPANTSVPEFVEDIDLCFVFSDITNITLQNVGTVYALQRDLLKKPDLFVGLTKPSNVSSPYLWYQTFGEDIGFAGSDYENDVDVGTDTDTSGEGVVLNLIADEMPLNVELNGEVKGVDNITENAPLEFIINV